MATYNEATTLTAVGAYTTDDKEDRQFSVSLTEVSNTTDVQVVSVEAS